MLYEVITKAHHPETKRLYTEMVYQPMLELLAFLRNNDFKTFIVSGGGIEFMRPWTDRITSYNVCYTKLLRISASAVAKIV